MRQHLESQGVVVKYSNGWNLNGDLTQTKRGSIRAKPVSVVVEAVGDGSRVTVNGKAWAYLAGRAAAQSLPPPERPVGGWTVDRGEETLEQYRARQNADSPSAQPVGGPVAKGLSLLRRWAACSRK